MVYVYALQLEKEKYYIGKTVNPVIRLDDHFTSRGSHWTQKYKPLKCIELYENCNGFDEDVLTLRYMKEKGINNVRGGSFCEIYLNRNIMEMIQKMIQTHDDKCYRCGGKGHFANNCRNVISYSQPNKFNQKHSKYNNSFFKNGFNHNSNRGLFNYNSNRGDKNNHSINNIINYNKNKYYVVLPR